MAPTFIAIEGIDGVGKTSVRRSLYTQLNALGFATVTIPSHSWLDRRASRIIGAAKYLGHEIPRSELRNAYLTDKQCLAEKVIIPKLQTHTVVCDRYLLSDIVYLHVIWHIPMEEIFEQIEARRLFLPSITIMVESDVTFAMERLHRRDGDKLDIWETVEYQTALRDAFRQAARTYSSLTGRLIFFENSLSIDSLELRVGRELVDALECQSAVLV